MGVKVRERDGAWWIMVDHQGQRKARRVGIGREGQRAARAAAEKIQARLALGEDAFFSEAKPLPTFAEYAIEWLRVYPSTRSLSPNTLANYQSSLQAHLIPWFGTLRISEIDYAKVEGFVASKRAPGGSVLKKAKPLKDSSLGLCLGVLSMICERAIRDGLLGKNPVHGTVKFARVEDAVDPFTSAELRAILGAARAITPELGTLLRVWAQSGMREGEVLGLQWQDMDVARGTALVRRSWSRGRLGPTKTRRHRVVSLGHPITEDTPEWRPVAQGVVGELSGLPLRSIEPTAFVFGGTAPWDSNRLRVEWRRALAKAGVRYRPPEMLRHTWASTMLSRNAPLVYVSQQGGWRTAAVLLRVYARWMPQNDLQDPLGAPLGTQASATPPQPSPLAIAGTR